MGKNLTREILEEHLVDGRLISGAGMGIRIDHILLQDATGTMAMLEFEALEVDRVRAQLSARYVDHTLLRTDVKNADDRRYLQTASARFGLHSSRPGNGISRQVHRERFDKEICVDCDPCDPVCPVEVIKWEATA